MTDPDAEIARPPIQRWWVTYVLVGAAAIVAVIAALRSLRELLAPLGHLALVLLFAIVLAFVLSPLVGRIERAVHRRAIAVAITFIVALAVLVAVIVVIAAPLVRESGRLSEALPGYVAQLQSGQPVMVLGYQLPDEVRQRAGSAIASVGGGFAEQAVSIVVGLLSAIVDVFLVLVIALYLLLDTRRMRSFFLRLMPLRQRAHAERVEAEVVRVFGAYVRGQLILALVVGIASTAALLLLGVPYAIVLGVLAGILELVPMLGPILGAVPAVLVALFQPFPLVLWVVLAFVIIQQLEANLLVPRISGHAVGLHPLAAMLALIAGLEIGGIVG
ncbi:MAG TPA: AI-2E family transporter, partial [Candidatus Saccharimonadales bacterium]|nr:AI-2E family transporter [Candidatus Saccharimonadales bacterium]